MLFVICDLERDEGSVRWRYMKAIAHLVGAVEEECLSPVACLSGREE